MYEIIFLLLFITGIFFTYRGIRFKSSVTLTLGISIILGTLLLIWMMDFMAELLWFESLGYGPRFWLVELSQGALAVLFFIIGAGIVYLLTFSIPLTHKVIRYLANSMGAIISGVWGYANWENILNSGIGYLLISPILYWVLILDSIYSVILYCKVFRDSYYHLSLFLC